MVIIKQRLTSPQNPLIKHLCHLRQNGDYRNAHQRVFIEGIKLVNEVCQHAHTYTLVATQERLIPAGVKADQVLLIPEQLFKKISGVSAPEGLAAEVGMPAFATLKQAKKVLALDGVNDPGNLGTLLRTALALGWDGLFLLNESCDPFNEKAVRAAKGATFRLPLAQGGVDKLAQLVQCNQLTPYCADIQGRPANEVKDRKILLVLGNEAHGPSAVVKALCQSVTIPMRGQMESLNVAVAGGILMYALDLGENDA